MGPSIRRVPSDVEHRTDSDAHTTRLPGNDNRSRQLARRARRDGGYTRRTMRAGNVARVAALLAAVVAAAGSATSSSNDSTKQNYPPQNAPQTAPPPQQMEPARALGLWRST